MAVFRAGRGTLPALLREAGQQSRGKGAWIALAVATVLTGAWMFSMNSLEGASSQVTPNVLWWLLCGVLWGMGLIVPGMSPSSIFIFLGLYQPMTAGIAALDINVILPLIVGLVATVALLAPRHGVAAQTLLSNSIACDIRHRAGFYRGHTADWSGGAGRRAYRAVCRLLYCRRRCRVCNGVDAQDNGRTRRSGLSRAVGHRKRAVARTCFCADLLMV